MIRTWRKQEEQLSAARRGKHSNYMFSLRKHFNILSIHIYKEYLNVFLPNSFPCKIGVEKSGTLSSALEKRCRISLGPLPKIAFEMTPKAKGVLIDFPTKC